MHIRLYPSPSIGIFTPFSFDKRINRYACLWTENEKTVPVSLIINKSKAFLVTCDQSNRTLLQYRIPNRSRVCDCIAGALPEASHFKDFVESHKVVPTFSAFPAEAVIRAMIRQIIRADQAKFLLAKFINSFGPKEEPLRGFPSLQMLSRLTIDDYANIGLGLKAKRVYYGVQKLNRSFKAGFMDISGIGPWSRAIIKVDLERDFSNYPFTDKSGKKIKSELQIDIEKLAKQDACLAGDLYVYAMSYFEKLNSYAELNRVYIAYPMSNRNSDISDMDKLASWFRKKKYRVFSPHSRLFPDILAENTIHNLEFCPLIVADVSFASHGVGFEIGYAFSQGKKVIIVARRSENQNVSKFIQSFCNDIIYYDCGRDLIEQVSRRLKKINKTG